MRHIATLHFDGLNHEENANIKGHVHSSWLMHGVKTPPKSIEDTIRPVQTFGQANSIGATIEVECVQTNVKVEDAGVKEDKEKQSTGVAIVQQGQQVPDRKREGEKCYITKATLP